MTSEIVSQEIEISRFVNICEYKDLLDVTSSLKPIDGQSFLSCKLNLYAIVILSNDSTRELVRDLWIVVEDSQPGLFSNGVASALSMSTVYIV